MICLDLEVCHLQDDGQRSPWICAQLTSLTLFMVTVGKSRLPSLCHMAGCVYVNAVSGLSLLCFSLISAINLTQQFIFISDSGTEYLNGPSQL